jgi:trehalose 6-phosphate phosphatase
MSLPPLDRRCALFLDLDGTLLHIAQRPQDVRVDDALIALLGLLQGRLAGALAVISGRPLRELDALLAPLVLPGAGQHGAERRTAAGEVRWYAPRAPASAARQLAAFAAAHPGLILEDKGASLALHYRLAPGLADTVQREMQSLAAEVAPQMHLLVGKMVCELKPAGSNKGTAIAQFMEERPFRERLPVFLGDDVTDEYGFEAVNRMGGLSAKVGPGKTAAKFRLPDVDAVHAWLASTRL